MQLLLCQRWITHMKPATTTPKVVMAPKADRPMPVDRL
jgi:hypothetical protein